MNCCGRLFRSSVGKKLLMAGSGLVLVLFAFGHMVGNLQVFLGPEALNRYAHFLQSNKELLWIVRLVLLGCVILHIWSALRLTVENRAARPTGYEGDPVPPDASFASRTMIMSGLIIAAFVIYHLLHYTVCVQALNLTGTDFTALTEKTELGLERHDVYRMVVIGFRQPVVALFYVLAVGLLCLHLSHGIQAMFQSLGWMNHRWRPLILKLSPTLAWILFLGYVSVPLAVLLRLVGSSVTP